MEDCVSFSSEDSDSKSTANQVKLPVQLVKPEPTFVPEYQGDSNCFCIQLFCIKEELETRSLDFMASAFQCYPDRDFCILTVPHMVPEFALLQNFVVSAACGTFQCPDYFLLLEIYNRFNLDFLLLTYYNGCDIKPMI